MQIANRWGSDRVFYEVYNDKIEFKQPMFIWLASLMQAWNYMPEIWWVSVTFNVLQLQAKRQAKHEISFTFAFWCVFMEGFAHKEPVFLLLGKSITAFDAYTIFDFESRQNWGFSTVARKISFFRTKCDSFFIALHMDLAIKNGISWKLQRISRVWFIQYECWSTMPSVSTISSQCRDTR